MDDAHWVDRALEMAKKSGPEGSAAVDACLVHGGKLVAEGYNRR